MAYKKEVHVPTTDSVSHVVDQEGTKELPQESAYAFVINKAYRNYLPYGVVLINRNNVAFKLPPQKKISPDDSSALIIDVVISFSTEVYPDVNQILEYLLESSTPELKAFKKALNNNRVSYRYGRRKIILSYQVDAHVIKRNMYSVHIAEIDTVICKEGCEMNVVHPYSDEGQVQLINQEDHIDLFSFRVLINDPHGEFGERYININNYVYHVPVTVDSSIKPGVYVYADSVNDDSTIYHPFSDADEIIPLYPTKTLAEKFGDPKEANKRRVEELTNKHRLEIAEKEHELTLLKATTGQEELKRKQEHEGLMHELRMQEAELKRITSIEKRKLSEQQAKMEEEDAFRKAELNRLKHDLEMRGYYRKDASEFFKWLPAILAGAGALFTAYQKKS